MPPAVFLAVNHIHSLLVRGNARYRDGNADGFRILFAVNNDSSQRVFCFLTRAEGGGKVRGGFLAFKDNAGRCAQLVLYADGAFTVRHDDNVDIFAHFRAFRRKGQLRIRDSGSAKHRQQQDCQAEDRFSESLHLHPNTVFLMCSRIRPCAGPATHPL